MIENVWNKSLRLIRLVLLVGIFILGVLSLLGSFSAISAGPDSIQASASVLFINKFWVKHLGEHAVYVLVITMQLCLGVSMVVGSAMAFFKASKIYLVGCSVIFILLSMVLDLSKLGFTYEYTLLLLVKYIVISLILKIIHTGSKKYIKVSQH